MFSLLLSPQPVDLSAIEAKFVAAGSRKSQFALNSRNHGIMREDNEHRPIDGLVVEYVVRCNILELLGSAKKGLNARTQLTGEMARDLSFEWTNYTNRRTLENDIS